MPITKFADKLKNAAQKDKLPNIFECSSTDYQVSPFLDRPSGSNWERAHLDWLGVWEEWDCDAKKLFTKKSKLEESGEIVRFFQDRLCLPWTQVTEGDHQSGSFYAQLAALASWVEPTRVHQPHFVLPSSSPAGSEESEKEFEDPEEPEDSEAIDIPRSKKPAESTSEPSPSASPKFRSSLPAHSLPDKDETFHHTSSTPIAPASGIAEMTPKISLEKDVELVISAFLSLIGDALKSTKADITDVEAQEQGLRAQVG